MIILTKENILSYIKEHVPSLQLKEPVKVSMIGEGDLGEDVEGDGYCNYVFRVSDADGYSYIVKQSTEHLKRRGRALTPTRNRFEYEIMELRAKIVPQYVPALYLGDPENNVFIMEDVSNLKLIRFQMNKNHLFPELAKQGAQYLAATHFYTSEFYLPTEEYRKLLAHFMNAELLWRTVFSFIFLAPTITMRPAARNLKNTASRFVLTQTLNSRDINCVTSL